MNDAPKNQSRLIQLIRMGKSTQLILVKLHMSLVVRKPVFEVSDRSDTNWAVQLLKMARGLKFQI